MRAVGEKLAKRVVTVATPVLGPGEHIEMGTFAAVGSVSVKRQVATAAIAGVLSGGTLMVSVQPKKYYVALTNERPLFFAEGRATGRPEKKLAMQLPRELLAAGEATRGLLTAKVNLTIEGQEQGLKLVFPLPSRSDAPAFAAALGGS
jgi:hypothetical protein